MTDGENFWLFRLPSKISGNVLLISIRITSHTLALRITIIKSITASSRTASARPFLVLFVS